MYVCMYVMYVLHALTTFQITLQILVPNHGTHTCFSDRLLTCDSPPPPSLSPVSLSLLFSRSYIHLRVHVVTQRHVAKATKVIETEDPKKMSRTVSDILGSLRATRTR
jgi:hypothetical protein